jgi:hypothetical protein
VVEGVETTHRYDVSHAHATSLELPSKAWTCTVGPIVVGAGGTERVRVELRFVGELAGSFEVTGDKPAAAYQILRTEQDPCITILVGRLDGPDGGTRLQVAA